MFHSSLLLAFSITDYLAESPAVSLSPVDVSGAQSHSPHSLTHRPYSAGRLLKAVGLCAEYKQSRSLWGNWLRLMSSPGWLPAFILNQFFTPHFGKGRFDTRPQFSPFRLFPSGQFFGPWEKIPIQQGA